MDEYVGVIKKYVVFSGRATRKEYWMFFLINLLISVGINLLFGSTSNDGSSINILGSVYSLVVLLPMIGVAIRRLHDTGRSGWWNLIALIPLVGFIVLIVFMATDSQPGENKYGPNPKGVVTPQPQV